MLGIQLRLVVAAVLLALLPAMGHAQDALKPLGMKPTAPEELGRVPDHFFWIRPDLQAAQDPLDGQIVFFNDQGHVVGRATLPPSFTIGEMSADPGEIRLLDPDKHRQVSIARNIDPAAVQSLQAVQIAGAERSLDVTRRSADVLVLQDNRRSGARSIEVRSLTGSTLAQAYDIGTDSAGNRFVVSEEIAGVTPGLKVRVFVRRYDRNGALTGIVNVPLDGIEVVPHDFISVTSDGRARVLLPTENGVKIREIDFSPPIRSRSGAPPTNLGKTVREIQVDTALPKATPRSRDFHQGPRSFDVRTAAPAIERDQIVKNAQAYLTVNWIMGRENFAKPGIENQCDPADAKFWLRPRHFTQASIGKTIGPMPYRWGGSDTPKTFKARIEGGALAGSICTCRSPELDYCLVSEAAGVDCSGLISGAWGIPKRGTSGLLDVATELSSLDDLRAGDAFDWPGHHVRLLEATAPGPELTYIVIESSTRSDCEGVCEHAYRPSELNGYRLIRYRGVSQ